ncbi:MAG TPA: hypothetical protein VFJ98_05370 [Mycobacteriales bacterium]|nr:hypothetical protein [Mycobacteriales bacterium]
MTSQVPPLPPRVVAFIRQHVSSLLQLEALLLVFEGGQRVRSAADVSAEMYLPEAVVQEWLDGFAHAGFCERTDAGYRMRDDPTVYDLLAEVADTYIRRKVSVGRLIFGPPTEDPKISLAEAFRLRRDDKRDR